MAQQNVGELIYQQQERFEVLDKANGSLLSFKQECLFALQQVQKSKYTFEAAQRNPGSLQNAICNIAAVGLSLNPATSHAYLVPRDNAICLDISFQGLKKLATDCGAIAYAVAELVYENDHFVYRGPDEKPILEANIFGDRGKLVGGYCSAKLPDGGYIVTHMTAKEFDQIQSTSKAKNGPWKTWPDEMRKKCLIKRGYKSWPQSDSRKRLADAVKISHESEGTAYTIEQQNEFYTLLRAPESEHKALSFYLFNRSLPESVQIALHNSFEHGQIGENKKMVNDLITAGVEAANNVAVEIACAIDENRIDDIGEMESDFDTDDWEFIVSLVPEPQRSSIAA